jgi:hypothetical protein
MERPLQLKRLSVVVTKFDLHQSYPLVIAGIRSFSFQKERNPVKDFADSPSVSFRARITFFPTNDEVDQVVRGENIVRKHDVKDHSRQSAMNVQDIIFFASLETPGRQMFPSELFPALQSHMASSIGNDLGSMKCRYGFWRSDDFEPIASIDLFHERAP